MLVLRSVLRSTLTLHEPEDYVVPLRVDVRAVCGDTGRAFTVGRLAMDRVRWQEMLDADESTFVVCDNDSQGMCDLHAILTGGGQELRDDFQLDGPTDEVLFAHRFVLHPALQAYRGAILDAAVRLHGAMALAAVWPVAGGLPAADLTHLGFRKVAGEPLFLRHWMWASRFEAEHPNGVADDFEPTREHQRWFRAAWRSDEPPGAEPP